MTKLAGGGDDTSMVSTPLLSGRVVGAAIAVRASHVRCTVTADEERVARVEDTARTAETHDNGFRFSR